LILGHIYIGTLGMEGAFEAMWSGEVDFNWAKEHHDLWLEDQLAKGHSASPRNIRWRHRRMNASMPGSLHFFED
jgi:cytochrome b subunit of formate dehydrogenase